MRTSTIYSVSGLVVGLSIIAIMINYCIYQFPGNNYFPNHTLLWAIYLILTNAGLILCFGKESLMSRRGIELFYFFIVLSIIALATNAVQLTPFSPIDSKIMVIEEYIRVNIPAILEWTQQYPAFRSILGTIYDSLPNQIIFLPMIVILSGRFTVMREYYFLMLTTTLIGFGFYYFFPTTAPASVLNSPFFMDTQIATGFKFNQIHNHIKPTTLEGGMIASPSFHVIWSILCVFLLKEWPVYCFMLFIFNLFLIASCVLLGWHYVTDIIAGFLVVGMSFGLLHFYKKKQYPVFKRHSVQV